MLNQICDFHCCHFSLQVAHGAGEISHQHPLLFSCIGAWWQITHSSHFYLPLSSSHLCSSPLLFSFFLFFFSFSRFRQTYIKFLYHLQMPYIAERPEVSWACVFTKNGPLVNTQALLSVQLRVNWILFEFFYFPK